MSAWEVNLEDNTVRHPDLDISIQFVEEGNEWRGMLGPTSFAPPGGLPLGDLPRLLKEADDAFREAKGLPLQPWDFLEDEEYDDD